MRRNLGSEVLIAIGGLSVIICGLFFALLLSNTSNNGGATTIPSSLVTTVAQSNTDDNASPVSSELTIQPTITINANLIATATAEAQANQGKSTQETEVATVTIVFDPTDHEPEVSSDTPEPSATRKPTNTPEPTATATPRPTATRRPTDTPEPTATETASNTPRPSATSTSPNAFTGIIPTLPSSPTVSPLNEPTRTPSSCQLPRGWTTYRVQSGDTLFAISLVTNSTVDDLRFANCIDDIDNITAGDAIFVPIAPIRPVSTFVPSGVRGGLAAVGCTSPTTQISSPVTAQRVSGAFTVNGTATRPDFQYYKIEVRPDFADIYNFYSDSRTQVTNGVLGHINADLFGPGLHWVRLSVVDIRASIQADAICEIPVIFE